MVRVASGLSGLVIHAASAARRPVEFSSGVDHGRLGGDEREEGGRDLAVAAAATLHERGRGGARSVGRDERLGQRGGLERIELFQLGEERGVAGLGLGVLSAFWGS